MFWNNKLQLTSRRSKGEIPFRNKSRGLLEKIIFVFHFASGTFNWELLGKVSNRKQQQHLNESFYLLAVCCKKPRNEIKSKLSRVHLVIFGPWCCKASGNYSRRATVLCKSNESKFRRISPRFRTSFCNAPAKVRRFFDENSQTHTKIRKGIRNFEETIFRRSEISTIFRQRKANFRAGRICLIQLYWWMNSIVLTLDPNVTRINSNFTHVPDLITVLKLTLTITRESRCFSSPQPNRR